MDGAKDPATTLYTATWYFIPEWVRGWVGGWVGRRRNRFENNLLRGCSQVGGAVRSTTTYCCVVLRPLVGGWVGGRAVQ